MYQTTYFEERRRERKPVQVERRRARFAIAMLTFGLSNGAFAASQGVAGPTSIGTLQITLTKPTKVRISTPAVSASAAQGGNLRLCVTFEGAASMVGVLQGTELDALPEQADLQNCAAGARAFTLPAVEGGGVRTVIAAPL